MLLFKEVTVILLHIYTLVVSAERRVVKEYSHVQLTCPFIGEMIGWAGPPEKIPYALGNKTFVSHIRLMINQTSLQPVLDITKFSASDEGLYECDNLTHFHNFSLIMKKDPVNMTIENETDRGVVYAVEFQPLVLQCNVESGEPKEHLVFYRGDKQIKEGGPGRLSYRFNASWSDHKSYYTCKAMNNSGQILLERTIQLFIIKKPDVTFQERFTANEGENFTIDCVFESNDPDTSVAWYREGQELSYPLSFHPLSRHHSGNYTCSVENRAGIDKNTIQLTVQYPPDVSITTIEEKSKGQKILMCIASGVPNVYSFDEWEHKTILGEHIRYLNGTISGELIIPKMSAYSYFYDTGIYICKVSNGISTVDGTEIMTANYTLKMFGKPYFFEDNESKQYAVYGENGVIQLYVYSYPKFEEISLCDDNGNTLTQPVKYNIHTQGTTVENTVYDTRVTVSACKIEIEMLGLERSDFRNYSVRVTNNVSSSSYTVELKSAHAPEPPCNITAVAVDNTIHVTWQAGFDGGFPQTFVLQYRKAGDPNEFTTYCQMNDTKKAMYTETIKNLEFSGQYYIQLFSFNTVNQSNVITPSAAIITNDESYAFAKILGTGISLFALSLLVISAVYVLYTNGYLKRFASRSRKFLRRHLPDVLVRMIANNEIYQFPNPPEPQQCSSAASNQLYSSIDRRQGIQLGEQVSYISHDSRTGQHRLGSRPSSSATDPNLNYIDVCFDKPPPRFRIHGNGNRTSYSDIEFSIPLQRLPDNDDIDSDNDPI